MTDMDRAEGSDATLEPKRREPFFNLPISIICAIGVCVLLHCFRVWVLSPEQDLELLVRAAFIPARYSGEYALDTYALTSPITYAFLHGSLLHLAVNMIWLAAVGAPLANRIGPLRFALFWLVTALAAAGVHYLVHPLGQGPLVGASGAISGMMAASARYGFRIDRDHRYPPYAGDLMPLSSALRSRQILGFSAVWMGANLLVGLGGVAGVSDAIAWEAHIGGFVAGFLLLGMFDRATANDFVT